MDNKKIKKPFYKKWWIWVIAIIIIFSCFGHDSDKANDTKASETTLTTQDKELLKKHYKDFDVTQRTQFVKIVDKYNVMNDTDKNSIKSDFERLSKEREIENRKWEKEDAEEAVKNKETEVKNELSMKKEKELEANKWNDFVKANSKKLSAGAYTVGKHIAAGTYNVTFNGGGNFIVNSSDNELLVNEVGGDYGINKYKAILPEGSKIELKGMSANFKPLKSTLTPYQATNIHAGYWIVGTDITKGRYKASTSSGNGNFIVYSSGTAKVNEILGDSGVKEVIIDLDDNDIIDIKSLNNVKLTPEN